MNKWNFFTSKELKADGWLKRQLEIQAEGLSGNLDKVWKDVRDSSWIGGNSEGWERVPYWLDGFIPLAYLLQNQDMIGRAKKYIDAILAQQKSDGWICPCEDSERPTYDTWAVLLLSKVLVVYYQCSGDERIPQVLYNVMKNYYTLLKEEKIKLFDWGKFRWFEGFVAINFMYDMYKEDWITDLGKILKNQGVDYNEFTDTWERPLNKWTYHTHIVNIAMCLKHEAISAPITGDEYTDNAEELYHKLYKYNGTPVGLFTGDECLSGLSPIQGTELCAVVEQMYSYEHLYAYTGDTKWADRLEMLAFNALPATISDDMWAHQYVQMSNQIACQKFPGRPLFRTNKEDAHLFGLEPNYGCCTANFNQGWPKLALSAYMHNEDTVISVIPVPSVLNCDMADITLTTDYPFVNTLNYTITAKKDFNFKIRIPSFAQDVCVNGSATAEKELSFPISAGETKEISVTFTATPYFEQRPHGLNVVRYGSLVFSLPIKYEKKMYEYTKDDVERKFPYCDYEYIPLTDWSYGYSSRELTVEHKAIDAIPFSSQNPPVTIKAKVRQIDWGLEDGFETVCAKVPQSTTPIGEDIEIDLHPYGCSKLRMTELPMV